MKLGFFSKILGDIIDLMPEEHSEEEDNPNMNTDEDSDARVYEDE